MKDFDDYLTYEKEVSEAKLEIIRHLRKGAPAVGKAHKKRTSQVDIVQQVLNAAGYPLHISKIIESAERDFHVLLNRDSIVSNVIKKVNAGKIFIRTAPNTFALKEYSAKQTQHDSHSGRAS